MSKSINPRFFEPVPSVSPLAAQIQGSMQLDRLGYEIEQRLGDGPWMPKCRYGLDIEFACYRMRYWNRLCRGRRSFRVVVVLGESRTVVAGEGAFRVASRNEVAHG